MRKYKKSKLNGPWLSSLVMVSFVVLTSLLVHPTSVTEAQKMNQTANIQPDRVNCVSLSVTSDSNRLSKNKPIKLKANIVNQCATVVEVSDLAFTIERAGRDENIRFGDRRVGRIMRSLQIDNSTRILELNQHLEIAFNFREIRWMDSLSSIEVFEDFYGDRQLKPESYVFHSSLMFNRCLKKQNEGCDHSGGRVLSNSIEFDVDSL